VQPGNAAHSRSVEHVGRELDSDLERGLTQEAADEAFVSSQQSVPDLANLTWERFLVGNLVPVTIGNVVGGALMVGAIYWFVYLRSGRTGSDGAQRPSRA